MYDLSTLFFGIFSIFWNFFNIESEYKNKCDCFLRYLKKTYGEPCKVVMLLTYI